MTAKQIIESATNLRELQEVAYEAIRKANPVGERQDVLAAIIQLAFNFGRANQQTFQEAAAEFRAKHPY